MARSLANKPNVEAPDSDYPYGRIRDKSGGVGGTPVNEEVYGDIHQFFEKLMAEAGLTHNELPDNDYSGFQFFDALLKIFYRSEARSLVEIVDSSISISGTNISSISSQGLRSIRQGNIIYLQGTITGTVTSSGIGWNATINPPANHEIEQDSFSGIAIFIRNNTVINDSFTALSSDGTTGSIALSVGSDDAPTAGDSVQIYFYVSGVAKNDMVFV